MKQTDVYKQLLKSKVMAKFSHYCSGKLFYTVQLEEGLFQFPIETIEKNIITIDMGDLEIPDVEIETNLLSSDLGITYFDAEVKGATLNRWIGKSIDSGEFIKIG
jgi:hypothetical protein